MTPRTLITTLALAAICAFALPNLAADAEAQGASPWSWNQTHAKVLPQGDLEWAPRPFVYEAGATVRYIDYADGDDSAPGTRAKPWKHHPWDPKAKAAAAKHSGPTTYVFKCGVTYRGRLVGKESGTAEEPIRITSDPAWGEGEARFYGSKTVSGWKRGGHPKMPSQRGVWYTDLDVTPRHVWVLGENGAVTSLRVARTPNWDRHADPRDPQSQWWAWENPRWWEKTPVRTTVNGRTMHLGVDTKHLTRDEDYYIDALVWTQWGTMMGMPYAAEVEAYDPERKAIAYQGPWHTDTGTIRSGHRYYLEDKPHYLDQPGEFWFDKKRSGGRLYVRLPGDADPNAVTIEAGSVVNFIDCENVSHLYVSGLVFRFGDVHYDIAARAWEHKDVPSAVVRFRGSGRDVQVRNCVFEHVSNGVRVTADAKGYHDVVVADNDIQFTDHSAIVFDSREKSYNLRVMRNRAHETGRRGIRPKDNFSITLSMLQTAEIAGNVVTRAYGAGINVAGGMGGKSRNTDRDAPLVRILIHHNKVVDSLLSANDWGGIETWQSGPYYTYNNVSGNPIGPFNNATFGFAYYMDGSFKNYLFNNIAWGTDNDPDSPLPNYAAFQEIISYQNTFFNNTAFRFQFGTRRQAPQAGRNLYLGNVFQDISNQAFRHTDSRNEDPNARDAGRQGAEFAYHTNAYARNVLHDISGAVGGFHAQGGVYKDIAAFARAMLEVKPRVGTVGVATRQSPLRAPEGGDFRPAPDSAAIDSGVRVFVPWGLYATVGEWNFTPRQDDPSVVIDEHFFLTKYHVNRSTYYERPMYPLQGRNIGADDFVDGPLEDWTRGALRLNGRDQYLTISNREMTKPYRFKVGEADVAIEGKELQTADIHDSNFLIEAYVRVDKGKQGVLIQKRDRDAGYVLQVAEDGAVALALYQNGRQAARQSGSTRIADGQWHHVLAEVNRGTVGGMRIYVDGKLDGTPSATAPRGTLANSGDLLVGGGPGVDPLACTIDFLRIARGTLADAHTTIEELHAWETDGPFLRDFTGRKPVGERRDAGALEAGER
jgi:concanavalin A-like lectin/glucanase superfamily protein